MAYATHTSNTQSAFAARVGDALDTIRTRFERRRVYKRTLTELQSLSTRELEDLGLNRSSLNRIAYQAAYEV
ncbi:DUF1127 domain-containing protein [Primorskyibacter flagellatus]|uniref:YjiS-like domain-containing protein n=1 Tax=Primorskyibacter flagellatus TaxID=1387277 RepID=A0A1W2CUK6_9RHOB|nr:DUF1127 domain-containing protein [Primorskyibacter flagellatus]SMC88358.1 protein of unknown function [Primorskyibacter flagellatus]